MLRIEGLAAGGIAVLALATLVDTASPQSSAAPAVDRECVARLAAGARFDRAARPDAASRERLEAVGLDWVATLREEIRATPIGAGRANPAPPGGSRPRRSPFDSDPARIVLLRAATGAARDAAVASLRGDPAIEWIEPARAREICDFPRDSLPDDPLIRDTRQWALWNAGAAGVYHGLAGADIGARAAWAITCGSNDVRLAIADTGVDPGHPDLERTLPDGSARLVDGRNVSTGPTAWADSNGHGTAVAGVMAALTHDGAHFDSLGMAGVCGGDGRDDAGCRLIPIRITPGATGTSSSFEIARAIVYAADHGARAMNLSFAGGGGSRVERVAMLYAITRGCVVVAASGNRGFLGPGVSWPAAFAEHGLCVSVGASDAWDRRAAFSSYGASLDLVAPGLDIWTTAPTYPNAYGARYLGYLSASGTSFAAPHVAGTIGLLAAVRPDLADTDFQRILRATAHDVGDPGRDDETGAGRLDAAAALRLAVGDPGRRPALWHDERAAVVRSTGRFAPLQVVSDSFGTFDRGAEWRGVIAERFEATVTLALPDSFADDTRVWTRVGGTTTLRGDFDLTGWAPWSEVAAREGREVTLRGYLYRVPWTAAAGLEPAPDSADFWLPLPPDQARIGFTVFGPTRPRSSTGAPEAGGAALRAAPNPARGVVRLTGPPGTRVELFDIAGRRLGEVLLDGVRGAGTWIPRDPDGRPLAPGIVIARARDARAACRIVVLGDRAR